MVAILVHWWTGWWQELWELLSDRERLRQAVEGAGYWSPAAYVLLLVAQAVVAPSLAPALAFAGGFVFGTYSGFLLTWLGVLIGSVLCFAISRFLGRRFIAESDRLRMLDAYVAEQGAILVFVLRLIPLLSFDAISYAAGLTESPSGGSSWPRRSARRRARSSSSTSEALLRVPESTPPSSALPSLPWRPTRSSGG